jgi:hypothetical protein
VLGFGLVLIGSLPAAWALLNHTGAAERARAARPAPVAIPEKL